MANKGKALLLCVAPQGCPPFSPLSASDFVRPGWSRSPTEPELPMHNLIPIDELEHLTDLELIELETRLRNLIRIEDLPDADLRSCLAALSNAIYVRARRPRGGTSTIGLP
jgi:hypothetical protein